MSSVVRAQCADPLPPPVESADCGPSTAFPVLLSENTTGAPDLRFVGPPDDQYHGIGGRVVTYDFGGVAILDLPGKDFNLYEVDWGAREFTSLASVAVSADGQNFVNVKSTEGALVRIPGDETHSASNYGASYDLAGSGLSSARYVRITGSGSTAQPTITQGFELDAVGAIHFDSDVDHDGLTVCQEASFGTDPHRADSDEDGIDDREELNCGTDPLDADSDADSVSDADDVCFESDDRADEDGDGIPDGCDLCVGSDATGDFDGDGVCNDIDVCEGDDAAGDSDADQRCDDLDACPNDAENDADGDGVCGDVDVCLGADSAGDSDNDGTCDDLDACPLDAQNDVDADGTCGDADLCLGNDASGDTDSDQICNDRDACRGNDASGDSDGDLVCDSDDNCPLDANLDQADADRDGIGNICEDDSDVDGVIDDGDNCPALYNPNQLDLNEDGEGDACDADDDGDGFADGDDNCPVHANPTQADRDRDGQGDSCDGDGDADSDADGVADHLDACPMTEPGSIIDAQGCSGGQLVSLMCKDERAARHQGRYLACVMLHSSLALRQGLITEAERALIVRNAARQQIRPALNLLQRLLRALFGRR